MKATTMESCRKASILGFSSPLRRLAVVGIMSFAGLTQACSDTDLTKPQALEVLKKTVNFETDCILNETMQKLALSGFGLVCSVEKVEITGIAKANPNEPIVEYDVATRFDPLNLKQLLGAIEGQKKYYKDLAGRRHMGSASISESLSIIEVPDRIAQLEYLANTVQHFATKPVVVRKARSQFQRYDDGWRVIKSEWQGYSTRALTAEEIK